MTSLTRYKLLTLCYVLGKPTGMLHQLALEYDLTISRTEPIQDLILANKSKYEELYLCCLKPTREGASYELLFPCPDCASKDSFPTELERAVARLNGVLPLADYSSGLQRRAFHQLIYQSLELLGLSTRVPTL